MLITGNVYDKSVPSIETVDLLDYFLTKLMEMLLIRLLSARIMIYWVAWSLQKYELHQLDGDFSCVINITLS